MRHLKRFKNWLVVVYYACWTYSQQDRALEDNSDQPEANMLADGAGSTESGLIEVEAFHAESEVKQVSIATPPLQQQSAASEVAETFETKVVECEPTPKVEVTKAITPNQKVAKFSQEPTSPQSANVRVSKTQLPQTSTSVSAKVSSNGTKSTDNGQQTTTNGKYQPGAINDQTAQRLARLLVSEIKLYYKSKSEGDDFVEASNIYDVLKDPIEKSRKHYNQRMGKTAIETMPDYFHGELVRTLCGGDASRLGPNYPSHKSV